VSAIKTGELLEKNGLVPEGNAIFERAVALNNAPKVTLSFDT
jgi:hypothetical protein